MVLLGQIGIGFGDLPIYLVIGKDGDVAVGVGDRDQIADCVVLELCRRRWVCVGDGDAPIDRIVGVGRGVSVAV